MINTYLDVPGFLGYPTGVDLTNSLGASTHLAADVSAGATTLSVDLAGGFAPGPAVLFDGARSERIAITQASGTTLTLTKSLEVAHTAGANIAQCVIRWRGDTGRNSLPESLIAASSWVDNTTQRILGTNTYVNERSRLIIDNQGYLIVRPLQWPVTQLTSLSVLDGIGQVKPLDPTRVVFTTSEDRIFTYTGGDVGAVRGDRGWTQLSYIAGYDPLLEDVKEACQIYTVERLLGRVNFHGASSVQSAKTRFEFRMRGDKEGTSQHIARALMLLDNYIRRN